MSGETGPVRAATRQWLERFVIGLGQKKSRIA